MTRQQEAPYRRKGLSVFLTVLMVLSVIAMSATFAGTVAANHAEEEIVVTDGERLWAGQAGNFTGLSASDTVDLYEGEPDEDDEWIRELSVQDDDYVVVETEGLSTGDYYLDDDGENKTFEVRVQDLNGTSFAQDEVREGEVDLEIESNRGNFLTEISSDDFDQEDLTKIFPGYNTTATDDQHDEEDYIVVDNTTEPANFTGIPAGEYEFDLSVADSDAEATVSIVVEEAPDALIEFTDSTYTQVEGDIAEITIDFQQEDTTTIFVGDEDSGYLAAAEVVDTEEEGEVTVTFNTYEADDPDAAFGIDGDGEIAYTWDVSGIEGHDDNDGAGDAGDVETNIDQPLPAGDYTLRLSDDLEMDDGDVENAFDIATLVLEDRSVDDISVGVLPADDAEADEEAQEIHDAMTHTDTTAEGDRLVVKVEASGIFGALDAEDDVLELLMEDYDDAEHGALTLDITEDRSGVGSAVAIMYNESDAYFVSDADNQTFFLVLNTDDDVETDLDRSLLRNWDATFTLGEEYDYTAVADDAEDVSASFGIERADLRYDNEIDRDVQVLHDEEATVSGTTNVAPGTEFDLRIRGDVLVPADDIEVQEDGTWSATVDTTDLSIGDVVDVSVQGLEDDFAESGVIVEEIDTPDDEIQELLDEIEELEEEIAELEQERDDAQAAYEGAQEDIADLEEQVEDLSDAGDERDALQDDIDDALDEAGADDLDELVDMADGDDDSVPAFGPIAALLAILAGGAFVTRRRLN